MSLRKRIYGEDDPKQDALAADERTISDGLTGAPADKTPAGAAQPRGQRIVRVADAYGRELVLTHEEFRTETLPARLQHAWSDPDDLSHTIQWALEEGCSADVVAAAERLREIHPDAVHSLVLLASVLIDIDNPQQAVVVLRRFIDAGATSPYVLNTLAMAYDAMGRTAFADRSLREAVAVDCNCHPAVANLLRRSTEQRGADAAIKEIEALAAKDGAWMPDIVLAESELDNGNTEAALARLNHVADANRDDADVIAYITGELGERGLGREALELCLEHYRPAHHGPFVAANLASCAMQVNELDIAARLIGYIRNFGMEGMDKLAENLEQKLEQSRIGTAAQQAAEVVPREPDSGELTFSVHTVESPMWFEGLRLPGWLLEHRPDTPSARIALLPLSLHCEASTPSAGVQRREDESGSISRALLLALHEWLEVCTDTDPVALFPLINGAFAITTEESGGEDWTTILTTAETEATHVLTGTLTVDDNPPAQLSVRLEVWDQDSGERIATIEESGTVAEFGELLRELRERLSFTLSTFLSAAVLDTPDWYEHPDGELALPYAMAQAQLLPLSTIASGHGSRDNLWGESSILRWLANLAAEYGGTGTEVGSIMLLAGLALSRDIGSLGYKEYRDIALTFDRAYVGHDDSVFRRLTPLLFSIYDLPEEQFRRVRELGDLGPAYTDWLTRI